MTTFKRRGHLRTSKYGVPHWVSGTDVSRDDWWRSSGNRSVSVPTSVAYAYVNPNATCPVCGATVYFYQNKFGSRVYFDDLGPPWPKHPCTDNSDYYRGRRKSASIIEPTIRDDDEVAFVAKYKWAPYRIEWCEKRGAEAILVLKGLIDGPVRRLFLRAPGFARRAPAGSLVYYSRNRLSYFAPRRAKVVEIKVYRIRGAQRFIDTLLEFSRHSAKHT